MIRRLSDGTVLRVVDGPTGGTVHYLRDGNWHFKGSSNVPGAPTVLSNCLEEAAKKRMRKTLVLALQKPAKPYSLPQLRMDNAISSDDNCPACTALRRMAEIDALAKARGHYTEAEHNEMNELLKTVIQH